MLRSYNITYPDNKLSLNSASAVRRDRHRAARAVTFLTVSMYIRYDQTRDTSPFGGWLALGIWERRCGVA